MMISDEEWLFRLSNPDQSVPLLPSEEVQRTFCGLTGFDAMKQAMAFYQAIREEYKKPLSTVESILDFGCGWGRITRCFLRDIPADRIYGCDVQQDMITLCEKAIRNSHFTQNNPYPPMDFDDETFDIIYAYSVFSHLSENAHLQWLAEFHRLLKPRGLLIVTTRAREFIPKMSMEPYIKKIDTERATNEYDNGEFIHTPFEGIGNPLSGFYGETAIPEQYIQRTWVKWFKDIKIRKVEHIDQDMIIAWNPPSNLLNLRKILKKFDIR